MIYINSSVGKFSYDETTQRLFRDGEYVPKSEVEPVFSGNSEENVPIFSGLYVKSTNTIITLSGNSKPVVDINSIR